MPAYAKPARKGQEAVEGRYAPVLLGAAWPKAADLPLQMGNARDLLPGEVEALQHIRAIYMSRHDSDVGWAEIYKLRREFK